MAADATKARLVARGADTADVVATGIPIAAKFSGKPDLKGIRRNCGLRNDLPVLLVLSGGFGMGPVAEILAELDKVTTPFQTVVVTGRNEELRRELALIALVREEVVAMLADVDPESRASESVGIPRAVAAQQPCA